MECGEQCVTITGITMMPELCADNWGMVEVSSFIEKRTGGVHTLVRGQMLSVRMAIDGKVT